MFNNNAFGYLAYFNLPLLAIGPCVTCLCMCGFEFFDKINVCWYQECEQPRWLLKETAAILLASVLATVYHFVGCICSKCNW